MCTLYYNIIYQVRDKLVYCAGNYYQLSIAAAYANQTGTNQRTQEQSQK